MVRVAGTMVGVGGTSPVAVTAASLVLGTWYFRRMERGFADVI